MYIVIINSIGLIGFTKDFEKNDEIEENYSLKKIVNEIKTFKKEVELPLLKILVLVQNMVDIFLIPFFIVLFIKKIVIPKTKELRYC